MSEVDQFLGKVLGNIMPPTKTPEKAGWYLACSGKSFRDRDEGAVMRLGKIKCQPNVIEVTDCYWWDKIKWMDYPNREQRYEYMFWWIDNEPQLMD